MSTVWPRLRLIEVSARTDAQALKSLVTALESGATLTDDQRRKAAAYLRRLSNAPAAHHAPGRGRPRSDDAPDIALDYLVCRELHGKAAAARTAVARAWRVSEATVKDAYTDWRTGAAYRLKELIEHEVGELRVGVRQPDGSYVEHFWTRRDLLEAVHADLQDRRAARNRSRGK